MDTKDIHLTEMARDLQKDHTGAYRRQLLEILFNYRQQFKNNQNNEVLAPGACKSIQQVFSCAETILSVEG